MLLEYSLMHQHQSNLNALEDMAFKPALKAGKQKGNAIKSLYKNHFMLYDLKQPGGVLRQINKYGVDHRTRFNLTPLMTAAFIGNLPLIKAIHDSGADKTLMANNGLNAWQILLSRILLEPGQFKQVSEMYQLLAPEAISIQVDGRLEKLDDHSMFGFLLNVFFSLWYGFLPDQLSHNHNAISAADLEDMLSQLPDSVLPPMKKKRGYISRYLSENEVDRETPRNRKLFKRIKRGHYILNQQLQVRQGDHWYQLNELLSFDGWCFSNPPAEDMVLYRYNEEQLRKLLEHNLDYSKKLIKAFAE